MSASRTRATAPADKPVIIMERHIDAPRDAVYQAWSDPEALAQWWGPDGFTITVLEMSFRVGGLLRFTMHGPDGTDYPSRILYRELKAREQIAFTYGEDVADDAEAMQVVATFAEARGGTLITVQTTFPSVEARNGVMKFGAVELGQQTYAKLAALVEKAG